MAGIEGLKAANTLTAQVITISAALLTFTVTFVEKFNPEAATELSAPWTLKASWLCLGASIVLGFWTLMATTGTMNNIDAGTPETNPERWNIRIPAGLMFIAFLTAMVFLLMAGWTIAGTSPGAPQPR